MIDVDGLRARWVAIDQSLCVVTFTTDGTVCDANDNFLRCLGYPLEEVRGRHHSTLVDPSFANSAEFREVWTALAAGRQGAGEWRHLGARGDEVWLSATLTPVRGADGVPSHVVAYARIVTEDKLRQADLQGQLTAIDKSQGLIAFDLEGAITEVNANFCEAFGYVAEELIGQHHALLVDPDVAASAEYRLFWDTLRAGDFLSGLYRRRAKDGRTVWIQASYNPILDLRGKPSRILKFATDVTRSVELAEAFEDAKRQSQHDPLTGLPNRVRLLAFMTAILEQPGRRLTVLYVDLDRFKPINDRFGHQTGDLVLNEIANRFRFELRGEQIAARIGGDEFIVAAADLRPQDAADLCDRLIRSVSVPVVVDGHELRVGASIGVSTSLDSATADELLRRADAAMYRSKQGGRGTYRFYADPPESKPQAAPQLAGDDVRRGVDAGEFFLDYQPRFNTETNAIASVEALVRWQHPRRGLVPPLDFIGEAERNGAIVPLGAWVLREACTAAAAWPAIGISVNVSPAQIEAGGFGDLVEAVLHETGLDPARLELEITESAVVADAERCQDALLMLKRRGIRIAMDDFGTGFSTLSTLRRFPFDSIKIDRQFIRDMDTREGGRAVVRAILAMAGALDLSVTAEGVETADQLAMLTSDRCTELQGFLLGRPMSADRITALLDAQCGATPPPETPENRRRHIRQISRPTSPAAA